MSLLVVHKLERAVLATMLALASTTVLAESPGEALASTVVPLNSCASADHGAPVVESLELDRPRLDVRRGARTVVLDAVLRDTGGPGPATGVAQATAYASRAGATYQPQTRMRRIQGDHWRGRLEFPRGSSPGTWTVGVVPADGVGLYPGYFPLSPSLDPLRELQVVAREDRTAPVATAVRLWPTSVDVRDRARRVRVTVDARDAMSGVDAVLLSLTRASRNVHIVKQAALRRVSGTARDGRWRGHIDLPRYVRRGWWVAELSVSDRTNHSRSYRSDFEGSTPPPGLRPVHVVSIHDRVAAEVTALSTSTSSMDIRTAPATVVIEARIRDVGSGVATASATILRGLIHEYQVPLRLVSGTRKDGTWRGHWTATTCDVLPGLRRVLVETRDGADNRGMSDNVAAALDVRNDDHFPPGLTNVEVSSTDATLTFDEDVFGITESNMMLIAYDAVPGSLPINGHWLCASNVPVNCQTGPVRTARFVADAPFPSPTLRLISNPEHVLEVMDAAGNPLLSNRSWIGYPPR